jgi:hypothetical protein
MSNQACLFAEDTKAAYNPEAESASGRAVHIAAAAYQVPAFWLFCFDSNTDFVEVETSGGSFFTLVAPMSAVRQRLADRGPLARALFPKHAGAWDLWERVVGGVRRRYFKLDPYEIWLLTDEEDDDTVSYNCLVSDGLDWVTYAAKRESPAEHIRKTDDDLQRLFALAGLYGRYDFRRRIIRFDPKTECAERFLYGWYEIKDTATGYPPDNDVEWATGPRKARPRPRGGK